MNTYRVAVAQLACTALDVETNVARCERAVAEASAAGASLVVLPELASSGYVLDRTLLDPVAETVDHPGNALAAWSHMAARHRVAVVAGFPERAGDRLYNSAVIFGPDGSRRGLYRKLHLFAGETDVFEPGDLGLPVFEVEGRQIGLLICYDLRFPEALRILACQGADLVAVPTAWVGGFDRDADPTATIGQVRTVRVLANLNSTPVACASQVGQCGPFEFLGSSVVVDPFGRDIVPPASRVEGGLFLADLDLDELALARHRGDGISPFAQRRVDVYDDLLGYRPPAAATNPESEAAPWSTR